MADPAPNNSGSIPRWVKVFGIIAIAMLLLVVIHFLTGGGPGMHAPSASGQIW